MTRDIGGYVFTQVCIIMPEVDHTGAVVQCVPHSAYTKRADLVLHRYGEGPFCRFRIPKDLRDEGVYALIVDDKLCYIGECRDLALRYNMGYGQISPRNCYNGGQSTNCRVNTLICQVLLAGHKTHIWFLKTHNRKEVEKELIRLHQPTWNVKGNRD